MIAGVTTNNGVVLSADQSAYAAILRASIRSSLAMHITSGTRTSLAQARAMLDKIEAAEAQGRKGADELHAVYKNDRLVDILLALPREEVAWAATIESHRLAGNIISDHQLEKSFDLRSKDYTSSELAEVVAAVKATGGKALVETAPAHIHVDIPDTPSSTWRAVPPSSAGRSGGGRALLAGGALLGLVGLAVWSTR